MNALPQDRTASTPPPSADHGAEGGGAEAHPAAARRLDGRPVPAAEAYAALPKVCLHDHLDGALRPATVLELARAQGHALPAEDAVALGAWFRESADSGSLERYLQTFAHTVAVMQSAASLTRVAREYVLDAAADGVVHGEVRWAPEQHLEGGLGLEEAVAAVAQGISEGEREAARQGATIGIRQILCAMRQGQRSLEIARLAVSQRGMGVVGFDLAGPEAGFPPSAHREALELCAQNFLPVTLHAGEADGVESIRSAVLDGRALRLGHGVRILEDVRPAQEPQASEPEQEAPDAQRLPGAEQAARPAAAGLGPVAAWVRDRGIVLEVCPCSNLQTDAAPAVLGSDAASVAQDGERARQYHQHPVDLLRRRGFAVTVSPDNRLMSATSMSHEFARLAEAFDYDEQDFLDLTLTAARAAFLPLDQREALVERILAGYAELPVAGA